MRLDLLDRIFTDNETLFYFKEAKEKAFLFLKCVKDSIKDGDIDISELEDYWIQLGFGWELNMYDGDIYGDEDHPGIQMTLYECIKEINGFFSTDTSTGVQLETI
jgi:hypothetical protein